MPDLALSLYMCEQTNFAVDAQSFARGVVLFQPMLKLLTKSTKAVRKSKPKVLLTHHPKGCGGLSSEMAWHITNTLAQESEAGVYHVGMCGSRNSARQQQEFMGKLESAEVLIVLMTKTFIADKNCVEQLYKICTDVATNRMIVVLHLERVSVKGYFLGENFAKRVRANFLRSALNGAETIPPKEEGLFQENFAENMAALLERVEYIIKLKDGDKYDSLYLAATSGAGRDGAYGSMYQLSPSREDDDADEEGAWL